MDQPTPTFGSDIYHSKATCHFSDLCNNNSKSKKKRKFTFSVHECKNKLKHSPKKREHSGKKSRSKSSKIKRHKCKNIKMIKENQQLGEYKKSVNNFIRNHRFELRDDFNEKNVNKFLSSKEAAFEIPIIFSTEIIF